MNSSHAHGNPASGFPRTNELDKVGGITLPDMDGDRALFQANMIRMAKVFPGEDVMLSWGFFSLQEGKIAHFEYPARWESAVEALVRDLWRELGTSPMWQRLQKSGYFTVGKATGPHLSRKKLMERPIGKALYKRLGLPCHLACLVHYIPEKVLITFSVFRKKPDFTRIEIDRLKEFRPYLIALHEEWVRERWERGYLTEVISRFGGATIAIDGNGEILFSTNAARQYIRSHFGPKYSNRLPGQLLRCCEIANRNKPDAQAQLLVWQFGRDEKLLDVHIARRDGRTVIGLFEKTKKQATRDDKGQKEKLERQYIIFERGKLITITKSEIEILQLITSGKTLDEISNQRGRLRKTVVVQLDQAQRKLGFTSRQLLFQWFATVGHLCLAGMPSRISVLVEGVSAAPAMDLAVL